MKKLYILFFLIIGFIVKAQIVNIPDANFKAKLLNASTSNQIASTEEPFYDPGNNSWVVLNEHRIDTNNDGQIQVSEAQNIKWLNIENSNINNLTGIEKFTNLKVLFCGLNSLVSLDISQNVNLLQLECNDNQFASLDLSQNSSLTFLNCVNNQLSMLNISSCPNLFSLECSGNRLNSLDFSQNIALKNVGCSNNQLLSLNVLNQNNLEVLTCYSNQLTSLDVSGLTNLKRLDCVLNSLSSLNASNCISLNYLDCNRNQLLSLNVSGCLALSNLDCDDNLLQALDVSNLSSLETLDCSNNQLTSLNTSGCINLGYLMFGYNQIGLIDVSELTNLQVLECPYNRITSLDLSNCIALRRIYCNNNLLYFLNIKNGINNTDLGFYSNPNINFICSDDFEVASVENNLFYYGYTNCHVNTYCSFEPGGNFFKILGNTKYDSDINGCDVSDINYPNLIFRYTNGTNNSSFISNRTGNYYLPVQAGNHTITPVLENPSYFTISPPSFVANFPTDASPFTQDFCVTANGVKSDVEVMILSTVPARPGFDATYKIVYRNKGNQVENGSVSLTFDDARLDYVSSNPVYDSSAINSYTWNYSNLQPFETREIGIVFNVNSPMETPAVNNGDVLNYTATITIANTDETPLDNTFILDQTVVGSYDPNDKTCLQGETIPPSEVGKYVHYVIRFENTGTFPAENIVVKDMIDLAKFDIATLVPLKSSHDFYTRINGNKVEFIFENINLDFNDATNDGYVAFKIKTLPSLVLGDTFTNNANIYFDYNFPITTNTYTTTVAALSTQDFDFGTYFTLYPNPAKDVLNIQTKQDLQVNSIEIYNQLGQIVMATTNAINMIDVSNLSSGAYFVKVNTEKGSSNAKFVKE
ncbi:T9SS type A sorting domain-containing protein [Flavobacterium sp. LMO8]|uniref:T9SS type A sorting domain-containing protein n=1 Tax=Flavobacterium sp. LMO8 TaxID=2654244 RepID=UPI001292B389|nr:T9SS type A sorting domain-containing protein [Flavobacterium sp. LMO8]MQP25847.1 T9SS type A sorting domain-containing protein [Flavobacterium sp. LMO8]